MSLVVLKMKQRISRQKNMFDLHIYIFRRASINILQIVQVPHAMNTHSCRFRCSGKFYTKGTG